MLVVFANNMTLVDSNAVGASVTTDPVAINGNSFATGITNVHKIFNAGTGLAWVMQVSNDGQTFVTQGPELAATTAAGSSLQAATRVSGVFARLLITFTSSAGNIGAATFDIHVNFDSQ